VTGRLEEPDEALLRAVLVKLFVDRQLVVDTGVVEEILVRGERSFAGARRVVEALDARSLAERRRVTRMLARQVLAQLAPADQDEPE
jgi:chromosomal replication initiation ATPase DnaA